MEQHSISVHWTDVPKDKRGLKCKQLLPLSWALGEMRIISNAITFRACRTLLENVFYVGASAGSFCLVIGPEIFVSMGPWASMSQQGPPQNILGWEPDTSAGVPTIK